MINNRDVIRVPTPFREAGGNIGQAGDLACLFLGTGTNLQLRDSTGLGSRKAWAAPVSPLNFLIREKSNLTEYLISNVPGTQPLSYCKKARICHWFVRRLAGLLSLTCKLTR